MINKIKENLATCLVFFAIVGGVVGAVNYFAAVCCGRIAAASGRVGKIKSNIKDW